MQYYRCKCGKREAWNSGMPVFDCQGCEECQTTLALSPNRHKPLIPHDFSKKIYNQHTGKPFFICSRCGQTDIESFKQAQLEDE